MFDDPFFYVGGIIFIILLTFSGIYIVPYFMSEDKE